MHFEEGKQSSSAMTKVCMECDREREKMVGNADVVIIGQE